MRDELAGHQQEPPSRRRGDGFAHPDRRGAAEAGAACRRMLDRQDLVYGSGNRRLDRLQFRERQFGQGAALRLGTLDDLAGHMMRRRNGMPEHPHQPVGEVGRGAVAARRRGAQPLAVGPHVAHHAGRCRETQLQCIGRLEHRHLVLLHVLLIGERQPLHHRQQRDQRAVEPAGLGAHQLGGVGVALLRHDRAAGGESVVTGGCSRKRRSTTARSPRRSATGGCRRAPPRPGTRPRNRGPIRHRANWPPAGRSRARRRSLSRSIGNAVPASAAAPSGHSFSRRRQSARRERSRPIIST